jgi:hypothetical protein
MVESTTSSLKGDEEDGSDPWEWFLDEDPEDLEDDDGPWAISLNGDEEEETTMCELCCDRPTIFGVLCDECLENEKRRNT